MGTKLVQIVHRERMQIYQLTLVGIGHTVEEVEVLGYIRMEITSSMV